MGSTQGTMFTVTPLLLLLVVPTTTALDTCSDNETCAKIRDAPCSTVLKAFQESKLALSDLRQCASRPTKICCPMEEEESPEDSECPGGKCVSPVKCCGFIKRFKSGAASLADLQACGPDKKKACCADKDLVCDTIPPPPPRRPEA